MINIAEKTLATIVRTNHNSVPILEKHHLDFCCKGKRTLSEACIEKGLNIEMIIKELKDANDAANQIHDDSEHLSAEKLITHILIKHHFYIKQTMPSILGHLEKVSSKHGSHYPYMNEVLNKFNTINEDMTNHMYKEEMILFPRIKEVENDFLKNNKPVFSDSYINGPIKTMEMEHDDAGELLNDIRNLTSDYVAPIGACTTFRVVLNELKYFEEDLHKHVHLENNILFPLAQKMTLN